MPLCKNTSCCASWGIHEGPTFGRGRLDNYGYWEIPCGECARKWEELNPGKQAWPFKKEEEKDAHT